MTTTDLKPLYRRFVHELFNEKHLDIIDELVAPDVVSHAGFADQAPGAAGFKRGIAGFFAAFPDLHVDIEDLVAEGDRVVGRFRVTGSHRGEFLGHPPTEKRFTYDEIAVVRVDAGKIVEHWSVADTLPMLQTLGVVRMTTPGE
jgi:steroid delta-isomerase-like uncharacterized protein